MPRPYTQYPCGIYGPRNLVRRHARKVKRRLQPEVFGQEPPILPPGQEQLFSFYAPALQAGTYTVTIEQKIHSPQTSETLNLPLPQETPVNQKFEVMAPQFSLPDDAVRSSFPPEGFGALAKTLPHVVLGDPHLPWARIASSLPNKSSPDWLRNQVPWLALLVFTADELTLKASQLNGPESLFANTSLGTGITQSQTLSIRMKVADVPKILSTISPMSALHPEDAATDVILLPTPLFSELFTKYDEDGNPVAQTGPDVSRYKYMAHVRDINTTGMAEAGVEDNGVFGIVVSHRTGPLSNTQPQPVVAHLVSIEGVSSNFMDGRWPINGSQIPYVAMASLYSWNFVTLPEGSFDIATTFIGLGKGLGVLRAPDAVINSVDSSKTMGKRLRQRLLDGYTLTKYRTATGEISAAIYRGPLTPTLVPYPLLASQKKGLTWLSNSGIDLQIMDPEVSIMDITYSVAWQLGKTLAVADQVFTTALGKLRTTLFDRTMNNAKAEILREHNAYKSGEETVRDLVKTIVKLNALHKDVSGLHGRGGGISDRWQRPQVERPDLSYSSPLVQDIFQKHADSIGEKLVMSSSGDGTERYDELNMPVSPDWMVVLTWVLDKMCLYSIPAQYLIIDPSYLAQETLRFFHVDRNWTDALIDGALSIGNPIAGKDKVRLAIHGMIAKYLYPSEPINPAPQFPLYGFLMHSKAVTQYPDLKVSICLNGVDEKAPMLRHENLDATKGVMICLLDQVPGDPGLGSITFTQPPHQQSFIAGAELDSHHIKTLYKRIFTLPDQKPDARPWDTHEWVRPESNNQIPQSTEKDGVKHASFVFKWGAKPDPEVRTLLPVSWANDVNTVLNHCGANPADPSKPFYHDPIPNAAMAGIQLNNPIYQLVIGDDDCKPDETTHKASFPPATTKAAVHALSSSQHKTTKTTEAQSLPHRTPTRPTVPHVDGSAPRVGSGFDLGDSHGYPIVPPPHQRPLRAPKLPEPLIDLSPARGLPQGPGGPPQYSISCVPIDNDPDNPGIPCGTGIPKDLVFKIVQVGDPQDSDYYLESFTVLLQLSAGSAPDCLLAGYEGPGPFMTSNVRFNVRAQATNDDKGKVFLAMNILPRSTTGSALPAKCKEMTFVLPVCIILPHDIGTRIPVWITRKYRDFEATTLIDYNVLSFAQT